MLDDHIKPTISECYIIILYLICHAENSYPPFALCFYLENSACDSNHSIKKSNA